DYEQLPEGYKTACEQLVHGLKIIQDIRQSKGRKLYFHCTTGEDRTGTLAGLSRMIFNGWNAHKAFEDEMCVHGYGQANPRKADFAKHVVEAIQNQLTPLYLGIADLVHNGEFTEQTLKG
ncbi:MAG: hypothetical protein CUN55_20510, partial [Phototrophicales bacterium]